MGAAVLELASSAARDKIMNAQMLQSGGLHLQAASKAPELTSAVYPDSGFLWAVPGRAGFTCTSLLCANCDIDYVQPDYMQPDYVEAHSLPLLLTGVLSRVMCSPK